MQVDNYYDVIGNDGPSTQMLCPHYPSRRTNFTGSAYRS